MKYALRNTCKNYADIIEKKKPDGTNTTYALLDFL